MLTLSFGLAHDLRSSLRKRESIPHRRRKKDGLGSMWSWLQRTFSPAHYSEKQHSMRWWKFALEHCHLPREEKNVGLRDWKSLGNIFSSGQGHRVRERTCSRKNMKPRLEILNPLILQGTLQRPGKQCTCWRPKTDKLESQTKVTVRTTSNEQNNQRLRTLLLALQDGSMSKSVLRPHSTAKQNWLNYFVLMRRGKRQNKRPQGASSYRTSTSREDLEVTRLISWSLVLKFFHFRNISWPSWIFTVGACTTWGWGILALPES